MNDESFHELNGNVEEPCAMKNHGRVFSIDHNVGDSVAIESFPYGLITNVLSL